ncbi:MAG TPA: helix-turn-helix transcriptional regulator [Nocardioides sp.]|uniref:helix-turn-helix domain-containing protein n=1 Tax=Nocardioides sp. TaxID=35761 RepID=UPI002BD53452|nr:helix-turn-helix transcriptional regulator [Nocardioides sp.]HTW15146.1 helix-turn-helix transcriptional regulator [Nocardioides sp.]
MFAARIQERRKALDWAQTTLAANLGQAFGIDLDGTAITRIEQGKRRVRLDEAVAITQLLGLDLHEVTAPHPGGIDEQLERARIALDSASYAAEFWQRERTQAQGRFDELQRLWRERQEAAERARSFIKEQRDAAEARGDVNALAGYDVEGGGDDRFDQEA